MKIRNIIKFLRNVRHLSRHIQTTEKQIRELKAEVKRQDIFAKDLLITLNTTDEWLYQSRDQYRDKRCFLICGGPSVKDHDLSLLDDEYVMAVNGAIALKGLKTDFFTTVSEHWHETYTEELKRIDCERIFIPSYLDEKINFQSRSVTKLNCFREKFFTKYGYLTPLNFSKDASKYISLGGSVTTVGLQILYYLGFSEVIILGLDHNYNMSDEEMKDLTSVSPEKLPHFDKDYYRKKDSIPINVAAMERGYSMANKAFSLRGGRVLNASKISKLKIFESVDYEKLFEKRSV